MNYAILLKELLETCLNQKASDLHISVGHPPILRIGGRLTPLVRKRELTPEDTKALAFELMPKEHHERFLKDREIDFSYEFENKARFRVNTFFQLANVSCALRLVPAKIPTVEELNLPAILHEYIRPSQGFILITGASSQGKSTSMAALIDPLSISFFFLQ